MNEAQPPFTALQTALLDLASEGQMPGVSYADIVERAGIGWSAARAQAAGTADILAGIFRHVDIAAGDLMGAFDRQGSVRDRLFEVFMARLDVMQDKRAAFVAIADQVESDLATRGLFLANAAASGEWMLSLCGGDDGLWLRPAKIAWLVRAQYRMLGVWRRDENPDLAETMRILDEMLKEAESWAGRLSQPFSIAETFRRSE